MAAQVVLTADLVRVPSTGRWRVYALDVLRGHLYVTAGDTRDAALANVQDLVVTQWHPEIVHMVGSVTERNE